MYGLAEVVSLPLFADDILIDTPSRDIVGSGSSYIKEPLVVPEVEVSFVPVIGDVALSMLVGVEGAWVNVDVGVELLYRDALATSLKELPEGCCYDSFPKGGYDAPRDEDVLCFHCSLCLVSLPACP